MPAQRPREQQTEKAMAPAAVCQSASGQSAAQRAAQRLPQHALCVPPRRAQLPARTPSSSPARRNARDAGGPGNARHDRSATSSSSVSRTHVCNTEQSAAVIGKARPGACAERGRRGWSRAAQRPREQHVRSKPRKPWLQQPRASQHQAKAPHSGLHGLSRSTRLVCLPAALPAPGPHPVVVPSQGAVPAAKSTSRGGPGNARHSRSAAARQKSPLPQRARKPREA